MKLSKRNLKIVEQLQEQIEHHALIVARRKANCPYLPDWFKDKPVAWHEGAQATAAGTLNAILMEHGCYSGFRERTVENAQFKVKYTFEDYYLSKAEG
ncbi:MAG: hypothetical protein CMF61_07950 [Magnetococcales bacterium]|nr:hypothetical protein [Magnetococcales bacterium]